MKLAYLSSLMLLASACASPRNDATTASTGAGGAFQRYVAEFEGATLAMNSAEPHARRALLYYAVDTAEPFMQKAVEHELSQLRSVCGQSVAEWMAFVNSRFPQFEWCRLGQIRTVSASFLPDGLLERIADPTSDYNQRSPYALAHSKDLNPLYQTYPMTHPEVFERVVRFAAEHYEDRAGLVVHVKSHGSDVASITGLTAAQVEQKTIAQQRAMRLAGPDGDLFLGDVGRGRKLEELTESLSNENGALGSELADIEQGFTGLGAASSFGTEKRHLLAMYEDFLHEPAVHFLITESCHGGMSLFDNRQHVNAFGTSGSLWYRNLDWDVLLAESGIDGARFTTNLTQWLAEVPSFVPASTGRNRR